MEACGSAHHWARWLNSLGIEVKLLPALYVRAYVKRNKPDSADACALLEAARCAQIVPGPAPDKHNEYMSPFYFASAASERKSPHCVARPARGRYDRKGPSADRQVPERWWIAALYARA